MLAERRLRHDDAGFLAPEFLHGWELAAQEFDVAARTGAAVGAQQSHAVEEYEEIENIGIPQRSGVCLLRLFLFRFGHKCAERGVEFAAQLPVRQFLVVNASHQRSGCFRKGLDSGEDIGVGGIVVRGAKLGDSKCKRGHELLVGVNQVGR